MALKWEDGALDWIIFDCDGVILRKINYDFVLYFSKIPKIYTRTLDIKS